MESESGEDFLISRGAPFFELQRQIGLLTRRRLNSGLRATIYITLTAGVPLVLGFLSGGVEDVRRMLLGPEFMARFVLFIAICFMMERSVDVRLRGFLRRFEDSGLLGETELARGATAVTRAIRLRNSWAAEFTCVALAIGFSVLAIWVQPVDKKSLGS